MPQHLHNCRGELLQACFVFCFAGVLLSSCFLNRVVFISPLLMLAGCMLVMRQELVKIPYGSVFPARIAVILSIYICVLVISAFQSVYPQEALLQLLLTIAVPASLALYIGRRIASKHMQQLIVATFVLGGVVVALNDGIAYFYHLISAGSLVDDFSHRWRVTAYILFIPFLLTLKNQFHGSIKVLLEIAVYPVLFLAALTGSRTAWGTIMLQILALYIFSRSRRYIVYAAAFAAFVMFSLVVLPHNMGMAIFLKGLDDNKRIDNHWIPAALQVMATPQALLLGYGYGTEVTVPAERSGAGEAVDAGAHNLFLQTLLNGGVISLVLLVWLLMEFLLYLWNGSKRTNTVEAGMAVAGVVAFCGYYLIAGLVGDPRHEPLALFLVIIAFMRARQQLEGGPRPLTP